MRLMPPIPMAVWAHHDFPPAKPRMMARSAAASVIQIANC